MLTWGPSTEQCCPEQLRTRFDSIFVYMLNTFDRPNKMVRNDRFMFAWADVNYECAVII